MRYIYTLLIMLLASLCAVAQPKHEVRAVWLATIGGIDWPHSYAQSARSIERQKDDLRHILDQLQQVGINTVLLQTRVRGTTIYPSDYEPWDGCLSGFPGKSPGYDALKFAIDECHKRGMELHAWMVTIPLGKWDALGCRQLRKKMPRNIIKIKADGYLNPESQQTADYLASLCAEVTKRYDIDGIHLDYIRYPEDMPKLKTLDRQCGRNNITRIVSAISRRVKSLKPWVKMSCSPIGKYDNTTRYWSHGWNANTTVCQDAVAWLRDGLMDELFPMMYFRDNHFFPFALDWKEQSHGRIVVPGLGIYFMSPRERDWPLSDITRELEVLRHICLGHAYFRSKFFTDDTKGIYTYVKNNFCRYPSLVPPMTWASRHKPEMPYGLSLSNVANNVAQLSWHHVEKDTTMMMFNIYASKKYPVDTEDARNLVAIRRQGRQLLVPNDGCTYYAVTATDRYGNESRALQEEAPYGEAEPQCGSTRLLRCDGKKVEVPNKAHLADTEYLLVESLQGIAVATLPYNGSAETINISTLKNGMYKMRSLNRKGMSHRLGMFIIKR
ncbi:MAG: family 10 glycosylhydrolase [Prevotella sp.]|uniref:glycoside hydrolase family 10 protein n=1 Tax=Prevotella sp. TaxID=59823 RepID=UPI0025D92EE0|nr:family 10 glycosylhydrolase [Prevotella sp.]MCI7118906.1 family 10 glycosylhydrolase [Prevotella sp.]